MYVVRFKKKQNKNLIKNILLINKIIKYMCVLSSLSSVVEHLTVVV
jgi:hypothetical protein